MSNVTITTTAPSMSSASNRFTFGIVDYTVFIVMLITSASIGAYFGFFAKGKNTTEEYLRGGRKMKTIPIAISLVASQLSGIAIMSVPAESYSFGFTYMFFVFALVPTIPIICFIIVPVFYENNISNCYEYLEHRFSKRTRQLVTFTFIFNCLLMLPVIMFVPSLAFSQVTGINIHLINAIVSSICVFYTMQGGIKAVVWTDVVQGGIMLSSVVLVGILGIIKVGGLTKVFENAKAGGRMDISFSWEPRFRSTVWNTIASGIFLWCGHIGLNQSCVQRIASLPTCDHAKRSLYITGVGIVIILGINVFIGIIMFAYYYGCDPILAGLVSKADKMMPFFVQDIYIMDHIKGMPGLFISCVFSASLSTMSATLNSLAGVVYFDYIKPFIKHTEARANTIMKLFIICVGVYCIAGGFVVQHFNSILQSIFTIVGITSGAVVGVFLLGMLVPRINSKVAMSSIVISVLLMVWITVKAQLLFKDGSIKYTSLPTTLELCETNNFVLMINKFSIATNTTSTLSSYEPKLVTTAFGSNRNFSIFEISFYWYNVVGVATVFLWAIPLSYIWKPASQNKLNPKLFPPIVRRLIKPQVIEMEELPLKIPQQFDSVETKLKIYNSTNRFT